MAKHVKGNSVANATSYELFEKTTDGTYASLAEASSIDFNLDDLELEAGDHTLVVKAKAAGYEDSEYSNEVTYTVSESGGNTSGGTTEPETPDGGDSGGGDSGDTPSEDTNLMPTTARLDENTVFVSGNSDATNWGGFKGTSPVVENDYVKVYCDVTQSLQGIRKGAPTNLTEGDSIKLSFYAKIGEGEVLTKNLQLYVAGSRNQIFTGLSTEWKLCEWTVTYESATWDRLQISMNTAQNTAITLYLKDFSMTVVE